MILCRNADFVSGFGSSDTESEILDMVSDFTHSVSFYSNYCLALPPRAGAEARLRIVELDLLSGFASTNLCRVFLILCLIC